MEIGITTDTLDSAEYFKGVANYTKSLIKNIAELKSSHKFHLIHFHQNKDEIYQLGLKEIMISPYPIPFDDISKLLANTIRAKKVLKDLDVIHFTEPRVSEIPLYYLIPARKVLTVHGLDLYVPPGYKAKLQKKPKDWVCQKLMAIMFSKFNENISMYITASQSLKRDLIKNLRIPEEKVKVIPFAASEIFKPKEFQKSRNFILSDVPDPSLMKVYYALKKKGIKHKLVIFGWRAGGYEIAKEMAANFGIQNDVILAGHLPQSDLVRLYNTADVYVRIADYEGFGLPPLEAMACGCPVVTTNVGSLPEVVGDAGIIKDLQDTEGLTEAIFEVLTNKGLRENMIKKGLERAKMFSWEKTAKETIKVYEGVC